jgi:hypothetical protein
MNPHTWRYQESAGFSYDATHAYNDKFGFRAGTCRPYHPFDALTKERFDILELPTSFMDWTALHKGMGHAAMMDKVRELCSVVEAHHGAFVPIFHNMYVNGRTHPDVRKTFIETIKYIKEKKYWVATGAECAAWWRLRERAKLSIGATPRGMRVDSEVTLPVEAFRPDGRVSRFVVEAGRTRECLDD